MILGRNTPMKIGLTISYLINNDLQVFLLSCEISVIY